MSLKTTRSGLLKRKRMGSVASIGSTTGIVVTGGLGRVVTS